jgi:hypothetical protein
MERAAAIQKKVYAKIPEVLRKAKGDRVRWISRHMLKPWPRRALKDEVFEL